MCTTVEVEGVSSIDLRGVARQGDDDEGPNEMIIP
jgi:hypothetical protein